MRFIDRFLEGGLWFGRHTLGIIFRPYETYRRLIADKNPWQIVGIFALVFCYFAVAAIVKTAAFRPFLLTKQFLALSFWAVATYLFMVSLLHLAGRLLGAENNFRGIAVGWGYSLWPTLLWFLATSLLYVFLPPPRTTSVAGVAFSLVYLVFSATLFFWKIMLSYLTLRFALRLSLFRILGIAAISLPVVGLYSLLLYKLGIYRIPFL